MLANIATSPLAAETDRVVKTSILPACMLLPTVALRMSQNWQVLPHCFAHASEQLHEGAGVQVPLCMRKSSHTTLHM